MPKHYAKKGKTKHDPIFDQLNEIDTQDQQKNDSKVPKTICSSDTKTR